MIYLIFGPIVIYLLVELFKFNRNQKRLKSINKSILLSDKGFFAGLSSGDLSKAYHFMIVNHRLKEKRIKFVHPDLKDCYKLDYLRDKNFHYRLLEQMEKG